jgi:hypothetical protein
MESATKEMLNYGVLGAVVVVLSSLIGYGGYWVKGLIEKHLTAYMEHDARRTIAAETTARTQEQLGGVIERMDSKLDKHSQAHGVTLDALSEVVPPGSPVHRVIQQTRGKLS